MAAAQPGAPGRGWYAIAALLAVAGCGGIVALIAWLVLGSVSGEPFLAPGRQSLELERAGHYLVWHEYQTLFQGRAYREEPALPRGAVISVSEAGTGGAVEVRGDTGARITSGETERVSVAGFRVERPGRYEIAVQGPFTPRVLSVAPDPLPRLLWSLGAMGLLAAVGFGGSLALAGWVYFRREQAAEAHQAPPPPAATTDPSLRRLAALVYGLQLASVFLGITFIAGVIVNYVKLREVEGTWLESHFRWQIRTFWLTLLASMIGLALALVLVGFVLLAGALGWMLYRAIKGWITLEEGRPMVE